MYDFTHIKLIEAMSKHICIDKVEARLRLANDVLKQTDTKVDIRHVELALLVRDVKLNTKLTPHDVSRIVGKDQTTLDILKLIYRDPYEHLIPKRLNLLNEVLKAIIVKPPKDVIAGLVHKNALKYAESPGMFPSTILSNSLATFNENALPELYAKYYRTDIKQLRSDS